MMFGVVSGGASVHWRRSSAPRRASLHGTKLHVFTSSTNNHRNLNNMSTEPARERSHRHRSPYHRHRSPHRHHHKKHARSGSPSAVAAAPALLPFNSPPLSKHDYPKLEAIFDSYLSIQKNLTLSELSHRESRGRFKSFISHYNRGDLARGWYERVIEALVGAPAAAVPTADTEVADAPKKRRKVEQQQEESSSDSDVGPVLPGTERRRRDKAGPRVPGKEELEMQKGELHCA